MDYSSDSAAFSSPGDSSSSSDSAGRRYFRLAKEGADGALDDLLEATREYLRMVARTAIDSDIQGKLSASDLVQETMIQANRNFDQFNGGDFPQFKAWLRRILINNLINHYRQYRNTQKRDLGREVSVSELDQLPQQQDSPSTHMMVTEDVERLNTAMMSLSDDFQTVLHLRHREQLTFPEIGQRMSRTCDAARMLWYRAFEQLCRCLERDQ